MGHVGELGSHIPFAGYIGHGFGCIASTEARACSTQAVACGCEGLAMHGLRGVCLAKGIVHYS